MKTIIATILIFFGLSGTSQAFPIYNAVDSYTGNATSLPNSSLTTESSWINGILTTIKPVAKIDNLVASDWTYVLSDIWRIAIPDGIDYFAVKTGNIQGNQNTFFLFENNVDKGFATVVLSAMGISQWNNVGKISHITYQVPEPSAIMLVLLGLVGIGLATVVRRERQTK